jgi:hypothetical protein
MRPAKPNNLSAVSPSGETCLPCRPPARLVCRVAFRRDLSAVSPVRRDLSIGLFAKANTLSIGLFAKANTLSIGSFAKANKSASHVDPCTRVVIGVTRAAFLEHCKHAGLPRQPWKPGLTAVGQGQVFLRLHLNQAAGGALELKLEALPLIERGGWGGGA